MDSKTIDSIYQYLMDCGNRDPKFKIGDIIRYTPTEIADLLKKMTEDKPPLGARPFEIVFSERIKELAGAIARYSENLVKDADHIKLWAKEIEELCDIVWYLQDDT